MVMKRTKAKDDGPLKRDPTPGAKKSGDHPHAAARSSCLDLARRAGFIGVYKNTPTDLSTNSEHMEGSGRD